MTTPASDNAAKAIAGLAQLQLIAEATVGYRRKLIEGGVGAEIADVMTKDFHDAMLGILKQQMTKIAGVAT